MRLIAGEARGRRLVVPRGLRIRPSGARLRETAFGILDHRDAIRERRVLDLFAGTGALGLEALSRGAHSLVAVEKDPVVAQILEENVLHCGFGERAQICIEPADRALERMSRRHQCFDLVLVDPPYRRGLIPGMLASLMRGELVEAGGLVLLEHPREESFAESAGYTCELSRRCGDSHLTLLRRSVSSRDQ